MTTVAENRKSQRPSEEVYLAQQKAQEDSSSTPRQILKPDKFVPPQEDDIEDQRKMTLKSFMKN